MLKRTFLTSLSLALLAAPAIEAQEATLGTDRPDFVEAAATVGKNRFQIETSIAGDRTSAGGFTTTNIVTPTLFRYGFADQWELRVETAGYGLMSFTGTGVDISGSGFNDVDVGVKFNSSAGGDGAPAIGWLVHFTLPIGSADFKGNDVVPSFRAVAEWELPSDMAFGIMPGIFYGDGGYVGGIFGAVLGKGLTDDLRAFVEVAVEQFASTDFDGNIAAFDVGGAYLLGPLAQIDLAVSLGLTENTPDLAWTVGFSKLW
ncbi:MAG: transporter [Gemmatimonadota bacterium]|nr:transporter [Gemmatimonadota bacterium]